MAYWGGAGMNFIGGAMTDRARDVAEAKKIVLASSDGRAMVNQVLVGLGKAPVGARPVKGVKTGPRASTVPKPPKTQAVYKTGKRKGQPKLRTQAQMEATEKLLAANYAKFGERKRAKEFGMRGRNNQTPLYI
jgi:hypothetical protein